MDKELVPYIVKIAINSDMAHDRYIPVLNLIARIANINT